MSGDGGLGMLLGELLTVALHRLPVKIVLSDNSSLGMVKLEMLVDGLPDFETDDYAAIASAAGLHAARVDQPSDVRDALSEALAHPGPALVQLVTDPSALSTPPRIKPEQVKGLAHAAGKVVLSGGVGQMLDMARANARTIPGALSTGRR
jgi:pyruvate dehydrogenase (quinone)